MAKILGSWALNSEEARALSPMLSHRVPFSALAVGWVIVKLFTPPTVARSLHGVQLCCSLPASDDI